MKIDLRHASWRHHEGPTPLPEGEPCMHRFQVDFISGLRLLLFPGRGLILVLSTAVHAGGPRAQKAQSLTPSRVP